MGVGALSGDQAAEAKRQLDDAGEENDDERGSDQNSDTGLSDTEIFDILRNSRRRAVLSYLHEEGGHASLKELTEYVASEEYGVAVDEVSADQHKRVYTALYQCHLPRLDEFAVIDFEKGRKEVTLHETARQVEQYLHGRNHREAVRVELTAAVVVASFVTLGVVGVGPLGAVPVFTWAVFTALSLFGIAAFQLYMSNTL